MSRCLEYYDAFDKNPDFCGMDPATRSNIKFYNEIRKKIGLHIKDRRFIVDNFTEGAARAISSNAPDEVTRTRALNYVIECLNRGETVTAGDLERTIKGWNKGPCAVKNKSRGRPKKPGSPSSGDFTNVKSKPASPEVKEPPEAPPSPEEAVRKEEIREAAANQPAHTSASVPVQNPPPNVEEIPCKVGKPCPGGRDLLKKGERDPRTKAVIGLGDKCEATGGLIRDVKVCPVIQRERAAQANASMFTTGGKIKALDERVPDILPRAAQNQPMELTIRFTGKQWAILKQVGRERQLSIEEAVLFLVDEAGERMEGA